MKRYRVLVVTAEGLIPPEGVKDGPELDSADWKMEYDVLAALDSLGHESQIIDVFDDLGPIRKSIEAFRPHVVFNLLHEFRGEGFFDHHIASYLELLHQSYTGCNPRGLLLARDKVLAKKLMQYHRIATPKFMVYKRQRRVQKPSGLTYPLMVKSTIEEASLGLSQASVVYSEEKLKERVAFIHEQVGSDALVEEYIDGRELYLGVIGNQRLETFPAWEVVFPEMPEGSHPIATRKVKWDEKYRAAHKIQSKAAHRLPDDVEQMLQATAKKIYRTLFLSGYARLDCRLRADGKLYCLEANPNCDLSLYDEFAQAAQKAGYSFEQIIQKILTLGLRYEPHYPG